MKKKYVKPSMEVYPMEKGCILCYSEGLAQIPTIPGQPGDDEKQLA